jgi:hypothetical protein
MGITSVVPIIVGLNHTNKNVPVIGLHRKWGGWRKTMKVTNRMRNKYPALNDEQIVKVVTWNKYYRNEKIKDIFRYVFGAICIPLIALLSVAAIMGTVAMIYNCFII